MFSNLRPLLFIICPQGFWKSKNFGDWTSASGGKKRLIGVNKWRKKSIKTCFATAIYTFYEQKFSNLRPLLTITFPQGFQKSKKFGHWTSENGVKRPFKGARNTVTNKILFSKAKFTQKQTCAVILHPLLVKVFKSETTSFHYFSPRILNL